jgi:hypothetical protein
MARRWVITVDYYLQFNAIVYPRQFSYFSMRFAALYENEIRKCKSISCGRLAN